MTGDTETGTPDTETAGLLHREFGTGLLRTMVTGQPASGYTWRRRNGPDSPAPFVTVDTNLRERITHCGAPGSARLCPGATEGDERVYRVRGPESVAGRLLRDGPDEELAGALYGLGRALRELHRLSAHDSTPRTVPRGVDRLTTWLDGRSPIPRASYAESFLRPRLGDEALSRLRAHCSRMSGQAGQDTVLCHGAAALGSLIPATAGTTQKGTADMLVGEDLCRAPWQFDVGWALGEIVELKWLRGDQHDGWATMIDSLFRGYGRDLGDDWPELAAMRILLHLHDYTSYVGFDHKTLETYLGLVKFLLNSGAK